MESAQRVHAAIYLKSLSDGIQSLNILMIVHARRVFERISDALLGEPAIEYAMSNSGIDDLIIAVHCHVYCHGHSAKGGKDNQNLSLGQMHWLFGAFSSLTNPTFC